MSDYIVINAVACSCRSISAREISAGMGYEPTDHFLTERRALDSPLFCIKCGGPMVINWREPTIEELQEASS